MRRMLFNEILDRPHYRALDAHVAFFDSARLTKVISFDLRDKALATLAEAFRLAQEADRAAERATNGALCTPNDFAEALRDLDFLANERNLEEQIQMESFPELPPPTPSSIASELPPYESITDTPGSVANPILIDYADDTAIIATEPAQWRYCTMCNTIQCAGDSRDCHPGAIDDDFILAEGA